MIRPTQNQGWKPLLHLLVLLAVTLLVIKWIAAAPAITVATFNIEEFPRSDAQVEGAFEAMAETEASIVALQEITDPGAFRRAAHRRLGDHWRARFPEEAPEMRPGLLFDTDRFSLDATHTHGETVVYDGARPVFEAEMTSVYGTRLELFVLHFKAGSDGLPVRREQIGALDAILDDHRDPDRRTLVLGDFNSTEPADRQMLATLADEHPLRWRSRQTGCTGYWIPEETCESFRLDHILADGVVTRAVARGPCESPGCDPGAQCPVFHRRVSDHCPVVVRVVPE